MDDSNPVSISTYFPAITGLIALLIAAASFYRDRILRELHGSKFQIRAGCGEPYHQCNQRPLPQYFVRFSVKNSTTLLAKKISFVVTTFLRNDKPLLGFIPFRLKWTHTSVPVLDILSPGQTAFVDLGYLQRMEEPQHALFGKYRMHLTGEGELPWRVSTLTFGETYKLCVQVFSEDGLHAEHWATFTFEESNPVARIKAARTPELKMAPETGFRITLDQGKSPVI